MTAAERWARAERLIAARQASGSALRWILGAALLAAVYFRGVGDGRSKERAAHVISALDTNAKQLATAGAHRDSTKAEAVHAVARSDTMRMATRVARSTFRVVDSTTVAVQRRDTAISMVVDVSYDSATVDSLARVPPLLVAYIARADAQITQDSITIAAQAVDIHALEAQVSLHVARDSLRVEQLSIEGHRKFWLGAKVGAGAVLVVRGAIWVIAHR